MKKIRDNSFITTLVLLPFILVLSIIKINKVLTSSLYSYLLLIMVIVFIVAFIIALFFALDEIINSNNKKRVILLMLMPIFYLPIYYTKYIYKNEKGFGYITSVVNVFLSVLFFLVVKNFVINYMVELNRKSFVITENYSYVDKNNIIKLNVDKNYVCHNDTEGYAISCENEKKDSFLGIFSYSKDSFSMGELDDIKDYHLEQVTNAINEGGYTYQIEKIYGGATKISYNDMSIFMKQILYNKNNKNYCLVIIKESSSENEDYFDFEEKIERIEFIG